MRYILIITVAWLKSGQDYQNWCGQVQFSNNKKVISIAAEQNNLNLKLLTFMTETASQT